MIKTTKLDKNLFQAEITRADGTVTKTNVIAKEVCKGLFYSYKRNLFVNKRGDIVNKEQLVFLKQKSCKGCGDCFPIIDYIKEVNGEIPAQQSLSDGDLITPVWVETVTYFEADSVLKFKMIKEND